MLNLVANTRPQQIIKEYLEQNASDSLADKINNGIRIEKDGKTLINKKTLEGFMRYATEEAKKQAEKGASSACIEGSVVFNWAVHYFEEDSIEEDLYNEDGTKYEKPKPPKVKVAPKKTTPKAPEPKPIKKPESEQISLFDLLE